MKAKAITIFAHITNVTEGNWTDGFFSAIDNTLQSNVYHKDTTSKQFIGNEFIDTY